MKRIHPIIAGLLLALVGIIAIAVSGCSTTGGGNPIADCATWQKAVALYEASLATGRKPSDDEVRAATVARAMIAVACGSARLVEPPRNSRAIAWPREPARVVVNGQRYDLFMRFHIVQDPTGVFTRDFGLATVTVGPFYSRVDSRGRPLDAAGCMWMLPLSYERGITDELSYMHSITCQ